MILSTGLPTDYPALPNETARGRGSWQGWVEKGARAMAMRPNALWDAYSSLPYVFTAQLLALQMVHDDPELAGRVAYAWAALSRATHHHGYELPATASALRSWMAVVGELVRLGAALSQPP